MIEISYIFINITIRYETKHNSWENVQKRHNRRRSCEFECRAMVEKGCRLKQEKVTVCVRVRDFGVQPRDLDRGGVDCIATHGNEVTVSKSARGILQTQVTATEG